MRILHTADWHIGKNLGRFSRFEEQKLVLEEICNIIETQKIDVVVIAGDLFDNYNPSNAALELFYKTLKKMAGEGRRPVIAIAGNHDSPEKIEAPDPLARECGIIFAGFPDSSIIPFKLESGLEVTKTDCGFLELKLPSIDYPLRVLFTPYANEHRLKICYNDNKENKLEKKLEKKWDELASKYCDKNGVNIFIAHLLFMNEDGWVPEEGDDEKSIMIGGAKPIYDKAIPTSIQYAALGHLHRKQVVSQTPCPVIYSGSPISYSLNEDEQDKYVVIIDIEPGKPANYNVIKLKSGKKLYKKRFESINDTLSWLKENQDILVELTIKTREFIKSEDKNRLFETHDGIITIIPEREDDVDSESEKKIDLNKNIEQLFFDYFIYQKGNPPDKQLVELFREIVYMEEDA